MEKLSNKNLMIVRCIVILKQVPADVCENCGEYYLSESVTDDVLSKAEDAVNKGAEVEIIRYVA